MSARVYILGMGCIFSWIAWSVMAEDSLPGGENGMSDDAIKAVESELLGTSAQEPPTAKPSPKTPASNVAFMDHDWIDHSRNNRSVPVRIYYPVQSSQLLPVIIMSHGLGGSRYSYAYLGRYWADHGYVVVHLQHLGSDSTMWRTARSPSVAMREVAKNIQTTIDRPHDVSFVLDQLKELATADGPLQGRLDLEKIGVAGHSMGAHTALLVAGEVLFMPRGEEKIFTDPRVKAIVAMSPSVRRVPDHPEDIFEKTYGSIRIPCLYFTSTRDQSRVRMTNPQDRRVPFDYTRLADRYLVIFKDADHMIFADRRSNYQHNFDALHHLICKSTTAFWNAYLRDSSPAASWLADGRFQTELGDLGTLEIKNK